MDSRVSCEVVRIDQRIGRFHPIPSYSRGRSSIFGSNTDRTVGAYCVASPLCAARAIGMRRPPPYPLKQFDRVRASSRPCCRPILVRRTCTISGEFSASSRSSSLREDHGPAVHSRHGRQAILSRSAEKEKQTFLRSKNVYGELDAMPKAW